MHAAVRFIGNCMLEDRLLAGDWATLLTDLVRSERGQGAEDVQLVKALQVMLRARLGNVAGLRGLLAEVEALERPSLCRTCWPTWRSRVLQESSHSGNTV